MAAIERWNDERLDELNNRLRKVESVFTDVAVMKRDLAAMTAIQRETKDAVTAIGSKLERVIDEPLIRGRDLRRQLLIGGVAALAGGFATFIGAAVAGVFG